MNDLEEIERSIIKKYRKDIWSKFMRAIDKYELIKENDKIAVCISGGKDSFMLAKCIQELKRHSKINFDVEYIVMNPGYSTKNKEHIIFLADKLNLPIKMFDSTIFEVVNNETSGSPCYLCARMRRGHLYSYAKSLGCNKIALGHHFDDVIETTLLNLFYGCEVKTMMPKLKSANFPGMELIRPLYMVKEEDIISWANYNGLTFLNCACRFTEEVKDKEEMSKRREMKAIIKKLKENNKNVDLNIFRSLENVNIDTVVAYRKNGQMHNFLDDYDEN